jgi:peptide/nickel transport system permease protein
MTSSAADEAGIDLEDSAPLSSQVLGQWSEPLGISDSAEAVPIRAIPRVTLPHLHTTRKLLRSRRFMIGFAIFATVALLAIFAPLLDAYNPIAQDYSLLNKNPLPSHWMGTDYLGRDVWSRLIWGGRTSLTAGLAIVLISFLIGLPWGIIAGFGGRVVDDVLMRLIDVLLAFPGLVLAYTIIAFIGTGTVSVVVALGIALLPGYARVARSSTLSTKTLDYVEAARAQGAGHVHIMRRHILPNIVDPIVILATLSLAGAILASAALSFLGIGTQLPASDWGTMLTYGWNYYFQSWAQVVFPALFIVVTAFGINLMGDGLGTVLNPQTQHR